MPEILEVEQYRAAVAVTVGRVITDIEPRDERYLRGIDPAALRASLIGQRIDAVRRRGKLLLIDVTHAVLGVHFGMAGRLRLDGDWVIDELEYASNRDEPGWDRFALEFHDRGALTVRDPRRLGYVTLDPDEAALGVDALTVDADTLAEVLRGSRAVLKARLMDQRRLAGLGNLLTDEILWRAGFDPTRPASSLSPTDIHALHGVIASTLSELAARGGSHTGDLHAERRSGGICPRDGGPLVRCTVGGRTTYACRAHQW